MGEKERERTNGLSIVLIIQMAIFMISLLLIGYIIANNRYTLGLCYLYPLVAAGWIMILGNGRLSLNIDECKRIIDISKLKYRFIIHVTSAKSNVLSKVDFWYQILGYVLIPIGLILSTVVFLLQQNRGIDINWISFSNIYSSVLIIYLIFIFVSGTLIRIIFLIIDSVWYKNNRRK